MTTPHRAAMGAVVEIQGARGGALQAGAAVELPHRLSVRISADDVLRINLVAHTLQAAEA